MYSSTNLNPTIGGSGVTQDANGTGTGSFSESITGLSPNTTYYVKAYATNSVDTSYGSMVSFTTAAITATITPATALKEENLDSNSLTVTLSGTTFEDSTLDKTKFTLNNAPGGVSIAGVTHNSTTGCTITLAYSGMDFDTNVTNFSVMIAAAELDYSSDLTSNALTITAKVETAPTLTTTGVSTYGSTTATLGGSVSADGGETVTERGVVYSTSNTNLTIGESGVTQGTSGTGTGAFNVLVSSLFPSTTYYVRAYATNSEGTSYGGVKSFTTSPISASIVPATALTEENLNTNSMTVTLSGTTFADGTLEASNFTLNNAPIGVSIAGVTHNSATGCTITLAYSGTDFDTSVTTFSVTIAASELASGIALTTNALTITATVEAAPTATIVVTNTALKAGETSLVTITFSAPASDFTNDDFITIENSSLSTVISSDGGITWTATLTPTANITDASNMITLANTGIADAEGNFGTGTTDSNNNAIDTLRPTAMIVVANTALKAGETSGVTITFSEAVTGFANADFTAIENGTLSSVSSSDGGITWTATLTPMASITDASNMITLNNTGIADAAGNAGTGTTNSGNYAIDTLRPTATIVVADTALAVSETSLVTITFSEAVTGFTNADITAANGLLSGLSTSDNIIYTATLYLFHDTIEANIRMGKADATMEEIIEAAKTAACHDFISAMPQGYQTIVGEGGSTLSGGEKQRVSIARALLKNAPIVLLDEATASLDPENEVLIQKAISALVAEKTVIVIAHRLQSVMNADQIIVLDNGAVKEAGNHAELLAQSGLYAHLWDEQSRAGSWQLATSE